MLKLGVILLCVSLLCSACGNKEASNIKKDETLQIKNGDRVLEFTKKPTRLVTTRQHITETALEIGLDKKIVGSSAIIDPPVAKHLQERYDKLPIIAEQYPNLEVLLSVNPDVVWVDRKWAFVKNRMGSLENIEKNDIQVYLSEAGFHSPNKLEHVYVDIEKMGRIFSSEKKAEAIILEMKEKVRLVQEKTQRVPVKVKVMDYDGTRNNMAFVGARCMANDLIHLAGGENIFSDIDKEWANVTWEEVVKRNPDVILVHEYRGVSGISKIKAIKNNPLLQDVKAVRNNCFVIVNLVEIYEGVRNAETVVKLAEAFYPQYMH